jgi:hypothetical protein
MLLSSVPSQLQSKTPCSTPPYSSQEPRQASTMPNRISHVDAPSTPSSSTAPIDRRVDVCGCTACFSSNRSMMSRTSSSGSESSRVASTSQTPGSLEHRSWSGHTSHAVEPNKKRWKKQVSDPGPYHSISAIPIADEMPPHSRTVQDEDEILPPFFSSTAYQVVRAVRDSSVKSPQGHDSYLQGAFTISKRPTMIAPPPASRRVSLPYMRGQSTGRSALKHTTSLSGAGEHPKESRSTNVSMHDKIHIESLRKIKSKPLNNKSAVPLIEKGAVGTQRTQIQPRYM